MRRPSLEAWLLLLLVISIAGWCLWGVAWAQDPASLVEVSRTPDGRLTLDAGSVTLPVAIVLAARALGAGLQRVAGAVEGGIPLRVKLIEYHTGRHPSQWDSDDITAEVPRSG